VDHKYEQIINRNQIQSQIKAKYDIFIKNAVSVL